MATIKGIKVGTTTITASYTDGGVTKTAQVTNFQVTAIAPTLTFTAASGTLTYTGSAQTIGTVAYNGDGTAYYCIVTTTLTTQPSAPTSGWVRMTGSSVSISATNAGYHHVFLKSDAGTNYTAVSTKYTTYKQIGKPTVNVTTAPTFVSSTLTYNGSNQTLVNNNAACSPSAGGTFYYYVSTSSATPTFSTSTWTTTLPTGKNAGNYYVWYYCIVSDTNNYTPGTNANTVKALSGSTKNIGQKSATVTAPSGTKVYDGSALTKNSGATLSGQVTGHTLNSATYGGTITNVGTANCTVSNAKIYSGSTDVTSNYSISYVTGTLTVTARPIKITAASDTKVYDGSALTNSNATAEASGTNRGLVSGQSMTSCTVTGSQTVVGSSNNVPSAAVIKSGSTDVTSNYSITYVNGTLEVTARTVTITTAPKYNTSTLTYNKQAQQITDQKGACSTGGVMYYYISTSNTTPTFSTASGSRWSTSYPTGTNAGTYYVWYYCYVSDTTNNTGTDINTVKAISGSKVINQREVTISWGTTSWVYNKATHSTTCTVGNLISGDSCTATLSGNSVGPNVGSATVTATALSNANYKLPSATADKSTTISITQRTATLAWGTTSWVYNGSARSTTCSVSNIVSGDTCTVTLSGNSVGPEVGTATVTATELSNTNYKLPSATADKSTTISITQAAIAIPNPTGVTTTYDAASHTATFGAATGASITKYRWSTNGTNWTESTTNPGKTDAGTYYVQAYYTADSNHSGSGWSTSATIKINQKAVTVTGGSATKKYDGSALTNSEATATGLITGHHLHSWTNTGSQTYVGSSNNVVSAATIYAGSHGGTETNVTSNYTISYVSGTLTVTKADSVLNITGVDETYTGGPFYAKVTESNAKGTLYWKKGSAPTTSSNDGSVNITTVGSGLDINITSVKDDQDDFTMFWLFVPSSTANSLASGHTYAENFSNANGSQQLTITPRNISNVNASATAVTYNGSQQTASVTITDSGATITANDYTISGNTGTYAGSYNITIAGKNNYTGTKTITWVINPKAITVTAGSASKVYDGTPLTKADGTTTSTLGSGDHLHSYTNTGSQTNVGSSNNVASAAKIYKGSHGGTESDVTSSYTITYAKGTLEVTARTVTITAPAFTTGTLTYDSTEKTILTAGSCTAGGTMYYYKSTSSTKPTFSTSTWTTTAPTKETNAGTYYVWYYCLVTDTTNNTGTGINTVTAVSGNSRTIGQRTVSITAPTKTNRTYTGSAQTIFTAGSCTAGGVMYYSETNSEFSTSTWSTTIPYTQKTAAGTYTIYWYCYVADTANNKGTGINTKNTLTATISQAEGSITYNPVESVSIYCTANAVGATSTDVAKSIEIASSGATSSTNAGATITYVVSQSGWSTTNGVDLNVPANTAADTYEITVTATAAATSNYEAVSVTKSITVVIEANVLDHITLTLGANQIPYNTETTTTVIAYYTNGTHKTVTDDTNTSYSSSPTGIVTITK